MTLKGLHALKTQETIKLDATIAIRTVLDNAKKDLKQAGSDEDWEEVETWILEQVTSED